MLVEFDFAVTQLGYIKAAMNEIPSFRPDGETPAQVQARLDTAPPVRVAYVTKKLALSGARTARHTTISALHEACMDLLAQGRSRFRKLPALIELFAQIPTIDRTFQETLTRAQVSLGVWARLPLVGTPAVAFVVGQGTGTLALAGLQALLDAARVADAAVTDPDLDFESAEADVHRIIAEFRDFSTAALELGRSQFNEGTPEREIIDAIPTEPATGGGGGTSSSSSSSSSSSGGAVPGAPQNFTLQTGTTSGSVVANAEPPLAAENVTEIRIYSGGSLVATPASLPAEIDGFNSGDSVTLFARYFNAAGESDPSDTGTATAG